MIKIAIIGTAGGKESKGSLNKELFNKMIKKAIELINEIVKVNKKENKDVTIKSGGAAWSDHVAVRIGNNYGSVEIYFPCNWDTKSYRHEDTGEYDWKKNPGRLANKLHNEFGEELGTDTQKEFLELKNVTMYKGNGFHDRNTYVANSHYLIAFTFSKDMDSYKGGTADTWKKCKGQRIHVNLSSL